jgi:hypothetical protein
MGLSRLSIAERFLTLKKGLKLSIYYDTNI